MHDVGEKCKLYEIANNLLWLYLIIMCKTFLIRKDCNSLSIKKHFMSDRKQRIELDIENAQQWKEMKEEKKKLLILFNCRCCCNCCFISSYILYFFYIFALELKSCLLSIGVYNPLSWEFSEVCKCVWYFFW